MAFSGKVSPSLQPPHVFQIQGSVLFRCRGFFWEFLLAHIHANEHSLQLITDCVLL